MTEIIQAIVQNFHLSHGLTLMVTEGLEFINYILRAERNTYLCWNPNDSDRAAREMWLAHTEERLRQSVRLGLITKGD